MTKKLFLVGILFFSILNIKAQNDLRQFYVGLDLIKSVPIIVQPGYVFEPSLLYKTKNNFILDATIGLSYFKKGNLFSNIDYQNTGHYFKLGVGKFVVRHLKKFNRFNIKANIAYSDFTETGKAVIKGEYYGDLIVTNKQRNQLFSFEVQPNYWLPIVKRFSLNVLVHFNYILNAPIEKVFLYSVYRV